MRRRSYWTIFGLMALLALGVQFIWYIIIMEMELKLPMPIIVLLVVFPGAMGWFMPFGFAWLWKDEIDKPPSSSAPS